MLCGAILALPIALLLTSSLAWAALLALPAAYLILRETHLSVEINASELTARQGNHAEPLQIPITAIEWIAPVRTPWHHGWGRRQTRDGLLWRVSGRDTVRIRLKNGTTFLLGTDQPDALVSALCDALSARRQAA